jgi:5,6-dimethylbenzimidazole synthase
VTTEHAYDSADREAVYRVIAERRDMRHFAGGAVDEAVLARLLSAAHQAPSVGLMQPWRIVRVTDLALRHVLHDHVEVERRRTADAMGERADDFMRLKVQGILDCAEVLVVALGDDRERHVFGRRTMPHMDLASVSCAIQNLWLAARAEGIGMGWVSMFVPEVVAELIGAREGAEPVAILCLGPVEEFYPRPMLEREKWTSVRPLDELLADNSWPS